MPTEHLNTGQNDPTPEALQIQLQQLNERSRWYASRLWALPFMYGTAVAAVLAFLYGDKDGANGSVATADAWRLRLSLFSLILLGVLVVSIMRGTRTAIHSAVPHLRWVEEQLDLKPTVKESWGWIDWPTYLVVYLLIAAGVGLLYLSW